jgi:hypothetical protein
MTDSSSLLMKKEIPRETLNDLVDRAKQDDDGALSELCEYMYGRLYI